MRFSALSSYALFPMGSDLWARGSGRLEPCSLSSLWLVVGAERGVWVSALDSSTDSVCVPGFGHSCSMYCPSVWAHCWSVRCLEKQVGPQVARKKHSKSTPISESPKSNFEQLLHKYEFWLMGIDPSDKHKQNCRQRVRTVKKFFVDAFGGTPKRDFSHVLTEESFQKFLKQLKAAKYSPTTIKHKLEDLNSFFKWLNQAR